MEPIKWIERKFEFSFPAGMFPAVIERLRGTPLRLENLLKDADKHILTMRVGASWTIQEHAGHLLDLDELHEKRLDQYIANMNLLIPADITNKKTTLAGHNSKDINKILSLFSKARNAFVTKAENVDETIISRLAVHPRLGKEMRLVDMLYFVAEHDDHHLAVIRKLLNTFKT